MHLLKPERWYHPSPRVMGSVPAPTPPTDLSPKEILLGLSAYCVPRSSLLPNTVIAWACLFYPLIFPKCHKPTQVHFQALFLYPCIPYDPLKEESKTILTHLYRKTSTHSGSLILRMERWFLASQ